MPDSSGRAGLLSIVASVVAVASLAVAGWVLYRSSDAGSSEQEYTDAQRADAKTTICTATDLVRRGVSLNTNLQPPGGAGDITGALAVAANSRVSLYDGGQYLLARLDPATPSDLADTVRTFANTLMDIGAAATAGAQNSDPDQAERLRDADAANATLVQMCK